mmetsp:Transcript_11068/g.29155  ORF Transcript_11068/g.29155 Transcript_11068/m.29155 type:complete len:163 (-) Transcript_11068:160-648(-)
MRKSLASIHSKEERLARLKQLKASFFEAPLVERRYTVLQIVGEGASGLVCSAIDNHTKEKVAVKRVSRGFDKVPVSVRILRELKFLRILKVQENFVQIRDSPATFDDVFVVFELMPTDLSSVLKTKTELTPLHVRYLNKQKERASDTKKSSSQPRFVGRKEG